MQGYVGSVSVTTAVQPEAAFQGFMEFGLAE